MIGLTYRNMKNPPINELIVSDEADVNFSFKKKR